MSQSQISVLFGKELSRSCPSAARPAPLPDRLLYNFLTNIELVQCVLDLLYCVAHRYNLFCLLSRNFDIKRLLDSHDNLKNIQLEKGQKEECPIPEYLDEYLEKYRETLLEAVAETSEEFMDRYFAGEEFSVHEIMMAAKDKEIMTV